MKRSRQSFYKTINRRKCDSQPHKELLNMVQPVKHIMPRLGGKKLYHQIKPLIKQKALKIGRDRFFRWLKNNDLLVTRKKSYIHTTQSNHRFWVYTNLTTDLIPTHSNQLWVSDITYIRTLEGFCYLALITDAYSRKIVGYDISDSLELEGCKRALIMALKQTSPTDKLIHHSDRGIQYCSNQYTDMLRQNGIAISMAAQGNCYENALAERVNGILKDEFNLDSSFKNKTDAIQTVHQSVYIYNQLRPHWAIDLKTPNEKHAA